MIRMDGNFFALETKGTAYCFHVMPGGFLEHLYYGKRLDLSAGWEALAPRVLYPPGDSAVLEGCCLEDIALEVSAPGMGDPRTPFVAVETADGDTLTDFRFAEAEILPEKPPLAGLPSAYSEETHCPSLRVSLVEKRVGLRLELFYTPFEDCDVLTRSARIVNEGKQPVTLRRLMSAQFDLTRQDYMLTTFNGAWAREFEPTHTPVGPGLLVNESRLGSSSNRANPFFMLTAPGTDEDHGPCLGFHLLYSGEHRAELHGNAYGKLRVLHGIQPEGFSWHLAPGESFTTPESAATWADGMGAMSCHMHTFIREHVVRGWWKHRPRPVLVNSWESFYFRFTHADLLRLARQGRDLGAELFVLDDGWFGKRDNAACSLGDWTIVNRRKLPKGLDGLAEEVRALGIDFGIWVEPEMVSEDSELYRAHPDWILGRHEQALGRHQYILDFSRPEVQDHIIAALTEIFTAAQPAYVKWDMNRVMTDTYSAAWPADRQGEVKHRYILGLYRVLQTLTGRFPRILFEGCAGGGNRTDPGILAYMPQVWLSDNTDALCRCRMQYYASFGYPQSVMGCHVSASPNHQTLRVSPLDSRFQVAAFGLLGYECDLSAFPEEERARIAEQIAFYKRYRETFQFGQLYRVRDGRDGFQQVIAVSKDRALALSLLFQRENAPNAPALRLLARGLEPGAAYHVVVRPVQLDPKDSIFELIVPRDRPEARDKPRQGEEENIVATGDVLMTFGAYLSQGFSGTGCSDHTRVMNDCASRLYVLEREDRDSAIQ